MFTPDQFDKAALDRQPIFQTTDLALAGVLVTLGHVLVDIDKTNPQKAKFTFKRNPQLENESDAYWVGKLSLDPMTFVLNNKKLKNRLFNG